MEQQQVFDFAGWSGALSPVHLDAPVATALIPLMAAAITAVLEKRTERTDEHESSLQQDHADAP
jgi:hypothetical protein